MLQWAQLLYGRKYLLAEILLALNIWWKVFGNFLLHLKYISSAEILVKQTFQPIKNSTITVLWIKAYHEK